MSKEAHVREDLRPASLVIAVALGAVAAVAAMLGLVPRAEALIYWASAEGETTIGRANLNGQRVNPSFITGASAPAGLDVTNSHVWWANNGSATIGRARIDGRFANQALFSGGDPSDRIWGLAVAGQRVYWTSINERRVRRALLDGSLPGFDFINTQNAAIDVAVHAGRVYWINFTDRIARARLDGTGINHAYVTVPGAGEVAGLDIYGGYIYWTDRRFGPPHDRIGRARLNGTDIRPNFIPLPPGSDPAGIAVTKSHIYWTNYNGQSIGRARLNGSRVRPNFIQLATRAYGIAVDWALNPGNNFQFGPVRLNRRNGTARQVVRVPGPGRVVLRGKGLRRIARGATQRRVVMPVRPRGGLRRALARAGAARARIRVTFRPRLSDDGPRTKSRRVTLRQR